MPKRSRVDWLAGDQFATHRILSLGELAELGVPRRTIASRCSPGGPWSRLLPGVVMLNNSTPTPIQRIDAALRYAGRGAVLTGSIATQLYGLTRARSAAEIHILVPAPQRRASQPGLIIERTTRLPDREMRHGFPAAPICRAVLDAVRRMTNRDDINALIAEAVQHRLSTPRDLIRELEAGSDRGSAMPRLVIREILVGIHSPAEGWARQLVATSALPSPSWNVDICDEYGNFLARPDAWFDAVALAWQIDSLEYHLSPRDYAATLARHAALTAAGVFVVHTLPGRLRSEPQAVLKELAGAYHHASQRCRPNVSVRHPK